MIEASVSNSTEQVGALGPSAAPGGTGECERRRSLSRLIVGTIREKCGIQLRAMEATFPIRRRVLISKVISGG